MQYSSNNRDGSVAVIVVHYFQYCQTQATNKQANHYNRHKSTKKSDNQHKQNIHMTIQVCYHYAYCIVGKFDRGLKFTNLWLTMLASHQY